MEKSAKLKEFLNQPLPQKLIDFIKQPISQEVISQIRQDSFSHLYNTYPDLNLRGYEGAIATYKIALEHFIHRENKPWGWGELHRQTGKIHYNEGNKQIAACVDTTWHKRVIGQKMDSDSGVANFFGLHTKKIIALSYMGFVCQKCKENNCNNKIYCSKTNKGTAKGMEIHGALRNMLNIWETWRKQLT